MQRPMSWVFAYGRESNEALNRTQVYSNDVAEESSPLELRNISVEIFQKKVKLLEEENRKLHEEATLVSFSDLEFCRK